MATKTKKRKEEKGHEVFDNPEVLAEKLSSTEKFFEENKTLSIIIAGVVAVALAGFFGYKYYITNQNQLAQADMFQAVFYFEQDSLNLALRGDGNNYGFVDIIEEYPGTDAANLANFYAGVCYMKTANYQAAILFLSDFSADDLVVQARSYSLIGDAHMELGEYSDAAASYDKASNFKTDKYFSPIYMSKAAVAYEKSENYSKAIDIYKKIISDYKESQEYAKAQKALSRLESMDS